MYELRFKPKFIEQFEKLDNSIQKRVYKKIRTLKEEKQRRHLKNGTPYFVEECGQYRILYSLSKIKNVIELLFVGKHKDYEKYYKNLF